jgi:hypothetical protein
MLRDIRKNKVFNRRALFLGAAQSGLAGVLVLRLGYLQLWKHEEYSIQSDSNRIKPMINPALTDLALGRWTLEKMRQRTAHLSGLACDAFALGAGVTKGDHEPTYNGAEKGVRPLHGQGWD